MCVCVLWSNIRLPVSYLGLVVDSCNITTGASLRDGHCLVCGYLGRRLFVVAGNGSGSTSGVLGGVGSFLLCCQSSGSSKNISSYILGILLSGRS